MKQRHEITPAREMGIILRTHSKHWTRRQIAKDLGMSKRDVDNHIRRLRRQGYVIPRKR